MRTTDEEAIAAAKALFEWLDEHSCDMNRIVRPDRNGVIVIVEGEHAACLIAWYEEHVGSGKTEKHFVRDGKA